MSTQERALASVLVPVYNAEKNLERHADSILCQTYGNLEWLLVDDGVSDRSSAICDAYASKDGRVIVIHQKNAGVKKVRNTGIQRNETGSKLKRKVCH